jgi:hypothetical protein
MEGPTFQIGARNMRVRTLSVAAISVAALALSTLSVGTAGAAGTSGVTATPGGVSAHLASGGPAAATNGSVAASPAATKCKTAFGTPFDDGIISWNNGSSGLNTAGAADFKCGRRKAGRTIKTVTVQGYFGDAGSTTFNVNVYKDLGGAPDDANVVCATTGTGTPTGSAYPTADTTVIPLAAKCIAKKGVNWLSVEATGANAWYWRTQSDQGGSHDADWRDVNNSFGSGCTTFQNPADMQTCIFGGDAGEHDFMFQLS